MDDSTVIDSLIALYLTVYLASVVLCGVLTVAVVVSVGVVGAASWVMSQ